MGFRRGGSSRISRKRRWRPATRSWIAGTVISTHVAELIRRHAWELLGRAETKRLLDALGETHPKLVEELVPKLLSLGEVQKVLQQLLRERVSIRDLGTILESLVEASAQSRALPQLVEAARQALGRRLTQPLLEPTVRCG